MSLEKPLDIALYASYEELRAFCQIWGLYGVKEMAFRSRGVLTEAVSILDTTLRMHEPLLQRLKAEYLVRPDIAPLLVVIALRPCKVQYNSMCNAARRQVSRQSLQTLCLIDSAGVQPAREVASPW